MSLVTDAIAVRVLVNARRVAGAVRRQELRIIRIFRIPVALRGSEVKR